MEDDRNKLNEPSVGYTPAHVRVFHSFEEAKKAELQETLNRTPAQRLHDTVALILRVYNITQDELNKRKHNTNLRIVTIK